MLKEILLFGSRHLVGRSKKTRIPPLILACAAYAAFAIYFLVMQNLRIFDVCQRVANGDVEAFS